MCNKRSDGPLPHLICCEQPQLTRNQQQFSGSLPIGYVSKEENTQHMPHGSYDVDHFPRLILKFVSAYRNGPSSLGVVQGESCGDGVVIEFGVLRYHIHHRQDGNARLGCRRCTVAVRWTNKGRQNRNDVIPLLPGKQVTRTTRRVCFLITRSSSTSRTKCE